MAPQPAAGAQRSASGAKGIGAPWRSSRAFALGGLGLGLVLAAIVCIAAWQAEKRVAGAWGFSLDDTWIHCQIARNIASGDGWSYNRGVPVQNSSGPLWTVLLVPGFMLGAGAWFAKILGVLCLLGSVVGVWRLARLLTDDDAAAGLAALFAGIFALMVRHALTAMETMLAALLALACVDAFYRWRTGRRRFTWPVLAALASMTRPECLVLVPLLAAEKWWRATDRRAAILVEVAIAGLVLMPYFALNLGVSGQLFPTTFGAKAGGTGLLQALRHADLRELLVSLTLYPYVWTFTGLVLWARSNLPLFLAVPLGGFVLARGRHRALAPILLVLGFPALRGIMAPHTTAWIQDGRYVAPVMPFLVLCAGVGCAALVRGTAHALLREKSRALRITALVGIALAVAAMVLVALRLPHAGSGPRGALALAVPSSFFGHPADTFLAHEWLGPMVLAIIALFGLALCSASLRTLRIVGFTLTILTLVFHFEHTRNVPMTHARRVRSIEAMDVALGRWVHANHPPGTLVAVNDIGAIAYFGERPIIDAIGLATPELVSLMTQDRLQVLWALRERAPAVVAVFENWFPTWRDRPAVLEPIHIREVKDRTVLGGARMVVYRTDWQRFERYYSQELIDRLDPLASDPSLAAHWRRGLHNMGLGTRAELFASAGDLDVNAGNLGAAERAYRRAVDLEPELETGWNGLVELLRLRDDRPAAMLLLLDMVRAIPTSVRAQAILGDLCAASGKNDEAKQAYEAALALHPDNVGLLRRLAVWHATHGDAAQAAELRRRYEELGGEPQGAPPPLPVPPGRTAGL